jgi:hypothetical protein
MPETEFPNTGSTIKRIAASKSIRTRRDWTLLRHTGGALILTVTIPCRSVSAAIKSDVWQ